jgi:transcriptional regulator with XRE-family HTH domain
VAKTEFSAHMRLFGEAVAACRSHSGMSREELARRASVPLKMVAAVEGGGPGGPGLSEICRIAQALGVTPCDLMKRYEKTAGAERWWSGSRSNRKGGVRREE